LDRWFRWDQLFHRQSCAVRQHRQCFQHIKRVHEHDQGSQPPIIRLSHLKHNLNSSSLVVLIRRGWIDASDGQCRQR
jgi:hypothetical protein